MNFEQFVLPYIRDIPMYQPGKPISETAREIGLDEADIIKLASNENPIGMSSMAHEAILNSLYEIARYPDGNGFLLKQALAEKHGVSPDQILLGNGSNDILELVSLACLAPGMSSVFSEFAFAIYPLMTIARGAKAVSVPALNFGHDLDAMLAAINETTKLVMVANPNNPTGNYLSESELKAFVSKVPKDVMILIDEAYFDYLDPELRFDTIGWLPEYSNLMVIRTLSKAYGLAGLRIGYAIAHPALINLLNRVRQPFNTNSLAQVAAVAALKDIDFIQRSYEVNRLGKYQLKAGFDELKLKYIEPHGNFITFKIADAEGVFDRLLKAGVIVRPLASYGMPDYLRVSIGLQTENEKFLSVLKTIVKHSESQSI